jgi:hypothetical protein
VEHGLGTVLDRFDRFFGNDRRLDLEAPSSRLRLKGWVRTTRDGQVSSAGSVAAAVRLPRLEHWLGNARLVVSGEEASTGAVPPPQGSSAPGEEPPPPGPPPDPSTPSGDLPRNASGAAELRFDFVRTGKLVADTGAGLRFTWPPVPYGRLRGHLVLSLGAGLVLRVTETLVVEMGPRGPGSLTDLVLERIFWDQLRLQLEGHGLVNQLTRGAEWSAQLALQWKVHRRTGLRAGVGVAGVGSPEPAMELARVFAGIRQDLWHDWVFVELEPELYQLRPAGGPRAEGAAVTLRMEVALDARPAPAAPAPPAAPAEVEP